MASTAAGLVAPQSPWTEERTIKEMFRSEWDISQPRDVQVEGIQKLLATGSLTFIQPTGSGKSLVFLGAATIRRGVSICVVPFHGLGSDQTAKANFEKLSKSVMAIHADECRGEAFLPVKKRLLESNSDSLKRSSIIIFISAKALQPGEPWRSIIEHLAKQSLIRIVCFDESHEIPLQGEVFRKEYGELNKNLVNVVEAHQKGVASYLAMSATFPLDLQKKFQKMVSRTFASRMWGRMDRRNINITVTVVGSPTAALKKIVEPYIKDKDYKESKVLVYTGFAQRAAGTLLEQMRKLLGTDSDAMALTGSTGIKEKSWLIDLFSGAIDSAICKLQILVGTAATKCGISSNFCELVAIEGFPRMLLEVVQVMGRAARVLGSNGRLAVVLSLDLFMSLVEHIQKATDRSEEYKQRQMELLFEVLRFFLTPTQCQHLTLEQEFSDPDTPLELSSPCEEACCYCRGEHKLFTGVFRRSKLIDILQIAFNDGPVEYKRVYSSLNKPVNRQKVWTVAKSKVSPGMVGALILQLLASGILRFVKGTSKINWALTKSSTSLAYKEDLYWDKITYTDD